MGAIQFKGSDVGSGRKPRTTPVPAVSPWAARLTSLGTGILRYGLVFLLIGIGSTKFFAFEAKGIQPLVSHSPFLGWLYPVLGLQGVSNFFGTWEVITGILIGLRPISPKISAVGSLAGIVIFLTTLSFLVTTPGVLAPDSPAGGFLIKDIVLLGASVYTAGEALRAVAKSSRSGSEIDLD
jgi:reactive chlorine resistance protein C